MRQVVVKRGDHYSSTSNSARSNFCAQIFESQDRGVVSVRVRPRGTASGARAGTAGLLRGELRRIGNNPFVLCAEWQLGDRCEARARVAPLLKGDVRGRRGRRAGLAARPRAQRGGADARRRRRPSALSHARSPASSASSESSSMSSRSSTPPWSSHTKAAAAAAAWRHRHRGGVGVDRARAGDGTRQQVARGELGRGRRVPAARQQHLLAVGGAATVGGVGGARAVRPQVV